ncbi:MAG: pirin family protein [Leptospiraceae bacterium]|nr:pirin family protein [Leptospiraceae bacterium]
MNRKSFLGKILLLGAGLSGGVLFIKKIFSRNWEGNMNSEKIVIQKIFPLGFQWQTQNPFLFCVHHLDYFPKGKPNLEPDASLSGRNIGQDFEPKDGWRMYHGEKIPGFPNHPHRGFETITIVEQGYVDHSDSLGASGRYGDGDTQWMTAGKGIQHSEMFPLLNSDKENTLELFQIWLNLPAKNKFVEPNYTMLWNEKTPRFEFLDKDKNKINLKLIAGSINGTNALSPPENSWANDKDNSVSIWILELSPNAEWVIPKSEKNVNRSIYFYQGDEIFINTKKISSYHGVELVSDEDVELKNGNKSSKLLFLQAKPILEPVVQYGPFVMNTEQQIYDAYSDFQKTRFGGWPWKNSEPIHGNKKERFAIFPNGKEERI